MLDPPIMPFVWVGKSSVSSKPRNSLSDHRMR